MFVWPSVWTSDTSGLNSPSLRIRRHEWNSSPHSNLQQGQQHTFIFNTHLDSCSAESLNRRKDQLEGSSTRTKHGKRNWIFMRSKIRSQWVRDRFTVDSCSDDLVLIAVLLTFVLQGSSEAAVWDSACIIAFCLISASDEFKFISSSPARK